MVNIRFKIYFYFIKGNECSVIIKKNIVVLLVLKCVSILILLQVVFLIIDYINLIKYGIWLILSLIIVWLFYFDLGFVYGFCNCFVEVKVKGDIRLVKEYVSIIYVVLFLLFFVILLIILMVNKYLNWSSILNIDVVYNEEFYIVFGLLVCFFCINIVVSVFIIMLIVDQKFVLVLLIQIGG